MTERHTLLHEAAHEVFGELFGWRSGGVTVQGGDYSNGCSRSVPPPVPAGTFDVANVARPLVFWPEAGRRALEIRVMIAMCGDIAVELLDDDPAYRLPDTAAEQIAEQIAELPEPTEEERAELAAMVNDPDAPSDEEQVTKLVWGAHGGDLASAAAWLGFLDRQVRQIVLHYADVIRWLADVLEVGPTLSGEAVMAMLRDRP